ncbi:MAG: polysaccharide deacetylase family protein [Patescibacteria group bacterium]
MSFEKQPAHPPFKGELKKVKAGDNFDVHKLEESEDSISLPEGEEKDFVSDQFIITEYVSYENRDHQSFVGLKKFYEDAKGELEDILPQSFFVEGPPSDPQQLGRAFYVIQNFDNPGFNERAKKTADLNTNEFSVEFLQRLLDIQDRLTRFLSKYSDDLPSDWVNSDDLDPKLFKEDVLYDSESSQIQISNFFKLDAQTAQVALGNEQHFEASQNRLQILKIMGLASLVTKIDRAIERSAFSQWTKDKRVHWKLDPEKLKSLEAKDSKAMALTFDDGPNDETEELLDILKRQNVKATFFLVGSQIAGREHIVKRIADEGHQIGVHEWSQEGLPTNQALKNPGEFAKRFVGPRQDLGDVKRTKELITSITGQEPKIGRVAGVHGTIDSFREFEAMNLDIIHGDAYDILFIPPTKKLHAKKLLERALKNNGAGKIRIFHIGTMKDDGQPMTKDEIDFAEGEVYPPAETLKIIENYIKTSQAQGYTFVGIEENI